MFNCEKAKLHEEVIKTNNKKELLDTLKSQGYDITGTRNTWIYAKKDGFEWEMEATKYSDGAWELRPENINKTSKKEEKMLNWKNITVSKDADTAHRESLKENEVSEITKIKQWKPGKAKKHWNKYTEDIGNSKPVDTSKFIEALDFEGKEAKDADLHVEGDYLFDGDEKIGLLWADTIPGGDVGCVCIPGYEACKAEIKKLAQEYFDAQGFYPVNNQIYVEFEDLDRELHPELDDEHTQKVLGVKFGEAKSSEKYIIGTTAIKSFYKGGKKAPYWTTSQEEAKVYTDKKEAEKVIDKLQKGMNDNSGKDMGESFKVITLEDEPKIEEALHVEDDDRDGLEKAFDTYEKVAQGAQEALDAYCNAHDYNLKPEDFNKVASRIVDRICDKYGDDSEDLLNRIDSDPDLFDEYIRAYLDEFGYMNESKMKESLDEDSIIDAIGANTFLNEIFLYLSTDEQNDYLESICKNWDIEPAVTDITELLVNYGASPEDIIQELSKEIPTDDWNDIISWIAKNYDLDDEEFEESKIKEIEKALKFTEKIISQTADSFLSKMEADEHFNAFMNTKLKDLPEKIKYSIGGKDYHKYLDKTAADYMKDSFENADKYHVFVSDIDNEWLGWIAFKISASYGSLYNVKFGSFYMSDTPEDRKRREDFMKDLRDFFQEMLDNYVDITFCANKENPFIHHYYNYLKKYNGGKIEKEGDSVVIFNLSNRKKDQFTEKASSYLKQSLKKLNENAVNSELPPSVDNFLQDIAQMYGIINYTDIINHNYTPEEIKKIKFYAKECRQLANEVDEEEFDSYIQEVVAPSLCKIFGVKDRCELNESKLCTLIYKKTGGKATTVDQAYNDLKYYGPKDYKDFKVHVSDSYCVPAEQFVKDYEAGKFEESKLKEAQLHHYVFLFSNGNGAASRGGEVDNYFNIEADAENLNDAAAIAWAKFNDYDTLEEWAEDEEYEPEEIESIRADVLGYIDDFDISGGDPWIEAIKEDDKVIREPDEGNMREYGYEFADIADADFWGLEPYSYDDEEDDWDDEDEEEDFDESKMKESECKYTPRKYSQYWYGVLDIEKDLMVWKDAKHLLLFHSKDEAQKACDELCKDDKVVVCSDGCLQLKEAKIKESDMKSFMRHMCEKIEKTSHLKEELKNSLDFQDIKDAMKNDEELAKFMNTPLKDLPENYKYIIGRDSWDDMKDVTPIEYSEFFYKMYPYFGKLLSEKDDELLGWISYNVYGPTIFDIKMFSFKPEYQNITFMRDLKEFFETIVNKYSIINWTADKDNPFIKHYYKAIEEYNGEAIENEDGFTVSFMIDKFKNRKDESKIEESEEEPTRDELKAKIKDLMTPKFNEDEWEPEDIELWKSIDWKERNFEEYVQEDPTLCSDVYFYSKEGTKIKKDVPFFKVIRANEIFPPYYKCMEEFPGYIGGMYDGRKYGKYMLMDRYETQEVYDFLGESKMKEAHCTSIGKALQKHSEELAALAYSKDNDKLIAKVEEIIKPAITNVDQEQYAAGMIQKMQKQGPIKNLEYIWNVILASKDRVIESFKLEVFDKNGKVIDYQAGFRTPSEARGFVDYNDDKYPAGYTFKITEAVEKNHQCSKLQESEKAEKALEDLFDKYVPMEGIADTVGGEIVRAINRIVYRYYNDGDMIAYDYGVDTCNSSYAFLTRYVGDIYDKYKPYNYMDDITYKRFLDELEDTVYNYLSEHEDLFTEPNTDNSRADFEYEDYTPEEEGDYYESKLRESYSSKARQIYNYFSQIMERQNIHYSYDDYQVEPDWVGGGMRIQLEWDKGPSEVEVAEALERHFRGISVSSGWGHDWDRYLTVHVDERVCQESLKSDSSEKSKLKEDFWNPSKIFEVFCDEINEPEANLWNRMTPKEREDALRPEIEKFLDNHKEDLNRFNIDQLMDDLTDNNWHTEARVLRALLEERVEESKSFKNWPKEKQDEYLRYLTEAGSGEQVYCVKLTLHSVHGFEDLYTCFDLYQDLHYSSFKEDAMNLPSFDDRKTAEEVKHLVSKDYFNKYQDYPIIRVIKFSEEPLEEGLLDDFDGDPIALRDYLFDKEKVTALDKEEMYILQDLIQQYGKPEDEEIENELLDVNDPVYKEKLLDRIADQLELGAYKDDFIHDVNNLRALEWYDEVIDGCDHDTARAFRVLIQDQLQETVFDIFEEDEYRDADLRIRDLMSELCFDKDEAEYWLRRWNAYLEHESFPKLKESDLYRSIINGLEYGAKVTGDTEMSDFAKHLRDSAKDEKLTESEVENSTLKEEYLGNKHPVPENFEIIELSTFKKARKDLGITDEDLEELKKELKSKNPESSYGKGVCKFRWCPKRLNLGTSESRVIYVEIVKDSAVYLVTMYLKKNKSELEPGEIKDLKELSAKLQKSK